MKIKRIILKNFRSFKEENIFDAKDEMNILLGQNNVGKSNIFRAINKLLDIINTSNIKLLEENDWYNKEITKELKINLVLTLSEEDLNPIITGLLEESNFDENLKTEFINKLGNELEVTIKSKQPDKESINFKLGPFSFNINGHIYINEFCSNPAVTESAVAWINIANDFKENKDLNKILIKRFTPMRIANPRVTFKKINPYQILRALLNSKLKLFEEIRYRPEGQNKKVYESFNGLDTADVLMTLSRHDKRKERDRFAAIQKAFNEIFPTLDFVSVENDKGKPEIKIISSSDELPLNFLGTGITEIIIFLTNLVGCKDKIFFIEEPELHLHPMAQKVFMSLLNKYRIENQLFIITHSIYFIDIENIFNNSLISLEGDHSKIKQLKGNEFDNRELAKIRKNLDNHAKEIFFSKEVILTEGETEIGAIPSFSRHLGKDPDSLGRFFLWVGGKDNFSIFIKLFDIFNISWKVLCDKDAIMEINNGNYPSLFRQLKELNKLKPEHIRFLDGITPEQETNGKKKFAESKFGELKNISKEYGCFSLSGDFESILMTDYTEFYEEAKTEIGNSKPRIGRYMAEKIINSSEEIPLELKEIINYFYN
jgi:putative ATP-dependent endonuclease of OLD family